MEYGKEILKIKPNEINTYESIATNYSSLGNYDEALQYYDTEIEFDVLQKPSIDDPKYKIRIYKGTSKNVINKSNDVIVT
ncbi:hypothetical protein [Clostridium ganghwense]|uniref:hypothetical protein n=1 Tax=Clostridium ganghwense TaxID=312089 RepID=UPI003AF0C8AD